MPVLAIDTALGLCSACVLAADAEEPLARESLPMERGHAETLLPLLDRVVAQVEGGFGAIERVVVTVGPGSYTGMRVGISAARGIALAAGIPCVGVTTLSALMAPYVADNTRVLVATVDARHGQIYFQAVAPGGRILVAPVLLSLPEAVRLLGTSEVTLVGSGAPLVAAEALRVGIDARMQDASLGPDIAWVARLGLAADPAQSLAKPVYLRAPDAKPQDQARLPRQ